MTESELSPSGLLIRVHKETRDRLLNAGSFMTYRSGQLLMRQGESGDYAILLLTGFVKVTVLAEDGRQATLAIRRAGDLIGEMACLNDAPRSATVQAGGEVTGRLIPRAALLSLLETLPDFAIEMSKATSERLRDANEQRLDLMTRTAEVRVCRVIARLVPHRGAAAEPPPDLSITQAELASLAGVNLRTVEKTIRHLSEEGIVRAGYRSLTILDHSRLLSVAEMTTGNPH